MYKDYWKIQNSLKFISPTKQFNTLFGCYYGWNRLTNKAAHKI